MAVLPQNPPQLIEKTLESLSASASEEVFCPKTEAPHSLRHWLTHRANLSRPTRSLIQALQSDELAHLLEDRAALRDYTEKREVWELPLNGLSPQELISRLPPLLPRFYSIASSMEHVGEEIHLTVRHLDFPEEGEGKVGICTHYLCEVAPVGDQSVPIYIQKAPHFRLPSEGKTPIIMVGPGTGIAPYRGFIQERLAKGATGGHWLFFGEWTRKSDFFYEKEWTPLVDAGHLHLETAFSRDQTDKIYVQHRLLEKGEEIWEWLEQGAHFYVCGDAKKMAPAVDSALQEIARAHGKTDPKAYVKALRKEGRYLRDVY